MFVKNKKRNSIVKVLIMIIGLNIILLSTGCITSSTDEAQITQIGKNIEKAIEEKDVDLFMENVSYDYSDSSGGNYDNRINNLPENIISEIEEAEELIDFFSCFLEIIADVSIPDDKLVFADIYASGKMKIDISLKACILWNLLCATLYTDNVEYNVDFIKEDDDDWKIISMIEM
jgi:hypothetical protein